MRLGYLVPEFPGQTHEMFWRELGELEYMGVDVDVVSTRPAARTLDSHAWSSIARRRTTYLTRGWQWRNLTGMSRQFAIGGGLGLRAVGSAVGDSEQARGRLKLALLGVLAARLAARAEDRKWDHLHVHSCASSADIARISHLMGGPTYSLTLHGPLSDYGPNQSAKWGSAAFGIAITEQLRSELQSSLSGSIPRIVVAGMGVDIRSMARPDPYSPWVGVGPPRVFSCGRLNPAKGHLQLIEAVAQLRATGLPVQLAIAGEDEAGGKGYRKVLQAAIADRNLLGAVTLLGAVPNHVVVQHLHRAHVFALASLNEPLGVAIMEAMAAGLPVVSTRSGGVPELVEDGHSGFLVPPQDVVELANALETVLTHPSLAASLSHAGVMSISRRMAATSSAKVLVDEMGRLGSGSPHSNDW